MRRIGGAAILAMGSVLAIVAGECLLRRVLPDGLGLLPRLIGVGAGIFVGRHYLGLGSPRAIEAAPFDAATPPACAAFEPALPVAEIEPAAPPSGSTIAIDPPLVDRGEACLERAIGELADYPIFTEILSRQMNSVTELSDRAATSILTNLTSVDKRIAALLAFIQQSGSNDKVAHVVSQIEGQIDGCREMLDSFASRQAEDARQALQQMGKISADTNGVLDALDGVNEIARQTTMLSLNVSIEAAQAGEAGRGFSIIGLEIRSLASRVQALSNEVHEKVEALMQSVTVDLQERAKLREQSQREAIANITETLSTLNDNLLTVITYNRDVMQKVETEGEAIGGPIMDIMAGIQFQDIVRQQLEQLNQLAEIVDDHIRSLGAALSEGGDEMDDETLSEKLDAEFGRYVMASQRQTHLEARGQAAAQGPVAMIELF